jgi:hypothetical protein
MQRTALVVLLAAWLLAPIVSYAESAPPAAAAPAVKSDQIFVLRPAQLLAVGAGVVVGAALIEALLPTELGYIVGGAVGGYLANIWYSGRELEIHLGTPPKT